MTRWMPSALLSTILLVMWLMLNEGPGAGDVLIGIVLAVALPVVFKPLMPFAAVVRRPAVIVRLFVYLLIEILRSCYNVARIIVLYPRVRANAAFIRVPLDLRDPVGLAVLSCIINSTPGTVWVELLPARHELALHVFDLHDADWWVHTIKTRYEQPLIEIFEGRAT